MSNELLKELEEARVGELAARREAGSEFAIICAIILGLGILQLFKIDCTFLILLFAPIGIFTGTYIYIDFNRRVIKEREKFKVSGDNKKTKSSETIIKEKEEPKKISDDDYDDGL